MKNEKKYISKRMQIELNVQRSKFKLTLFTVLSELRRVTEYRRPRIFLLKFTKYLSLRKI